MSNATRDFAKAIVKASKRDERTGPAFRTATVTAVKSASKVDVQLDDGTKLEGIEAVSKHIQQVGRKLVVGMNGAEPVIIVADLIAARTILADMIVAGTITANEITALLQLKVGQDIQSANFSENAVVGWRIRADGSAIFNSIVVRGPIQALPGDNILANGTFDSDINGWTAGAGSIDLETDPAQIDNGAGALRHTTTAGTETHVGFPAASSYLTIDPLVPYRLAGRVKPGAVGDICTLALRWYDASDVFISETRGATVTGFTTYQNIEVYAEPPFQGATTPGEYIYAPIADVQCSFAAGTPIDTVGDRYKNVDESIASSTDYVYATFTAIGGGFLTRASITSGALTGKTPTALVCTFWVTRGAGSASQTFTPVLNIGGTNHLGTAVGVSAVHPAMQTVVVTWTANPATGQPWTAAELEAFRNGGTNSFGGQLYTLDAGQTVGVAKMEFKVNWTSGGGAAIPAKVETRLYTDPLSAGGTTTRWDSLELRPQPVFRGGLVDIEQIRATKALGGHPAGRGPIEALLDYAVLRHASTDTGRSTTSTTPTDIDATNLVVTFVAPASGKVRLEREGWRDTGGVGAVTQFWGARDLSNVDVAAAKESVHSAYADDLTERGMVESIVEGLTPGTTYTWKWTFHKAGVGGSAAVYHGPNYGSLTFKVYGILE